MIIDTNPYRELETNISATEFELFCLETLNAYAEEEKLKEMISDNPAGQDDECTPFILIRNIYNEEAEKYIPITGVSVN